MSRTAFSEPGLAHLTRDPEIQATVDRLREAGCSPATVAAAERYADADAEFSALLGKAYADIGVPQGPQA